MSDAYDEIINGQRIHRRPPSDRHEVLVARLHQLVEKFLPLNSTLRLLAARSTLNLEGQSLLRPDLALIRVEPRTEATPRPVKLYLVAEVLDPGDHHGDTVIKKQLWTDGRLPRLWMVDPRYLNVEIYGCVEHGFSLIDILANQQTLTDPYLPGLNCSMHELFAVT